MEERRPLVLVDGKIKQLPVGDTVEGSIDLEDARQFVDGAILAFRQDALATSGQTALTVRAVGFTTSGKVQGVSLGDGNVVEVYLTGQDFTDGNVLYRELMSRGEPICFTGLQNGSIITSTEGFDGSSEQVDGADVSPMPLLSLGLSFQRTFFFAFRNSNVYDPGGTSANQGWIHVVNGPLQSTLELTDGDGNVIEGQELIVLQPWEYHRLYTNANAEYIINSTNQIMACTNSNMDLNPFGSFFDSRLIMPMTNDGITWPRSGQVSAFFDNTTWAYYVRDGAEGSSTTSPGSPTDFDGVTGATDADYEPNGATRIIASGLVSAFSGADSAGLEATPLMPVASMSQVVSQPLFIRDSGDGGSSGVAIASPFQGEARVYEWNTVSSTLELAYVVPLNRTNVTVTDSDDQLHPTAGMVANETVNGAVTLVGDLNPGIVVANVPITVVAQNDDISYTPTLRSQNGTTTTSIISADDETLSLGITPEESRAIISRGEDDLLYRRVISAGGIESWVLV